MRKSCGIAAVFVAAALTGCASNSDLEVLRKQVNATESGAKASQAETAKQLADMQARVKALEEAATKTVGRMEKDEAQVTTLNGQTKTLDTDLKGIKDEMTKLDATLGKTSIMFRQNLENMRDVYKRQFEAVSEILEKEKP